MAMVSQSQAVAGFGRPEQTKRDSHDYEFSVMSSAATVASNHRNDSTKTDGLAAALAVELPCTVTSHELASLQLLAR